MRNSLFVAACIAVLILTFFGRIAAQSNQVIIGVVKNGVAEITDQSKAFSLLKTNLSSSASLSDIKLEFSEFDGTYFLTARVANDKVSSIGVQLGLSDGTLYAGPGVGVEVTCTGRDCSDCRLVITKWRPKCRCEEKTSPESACDMTQKAIVNIGL